jgi:hypothetical protein
VALAEYNNVVKAFPSDRTDQPFSISILPRGARRRRSIADAYRSKSADKMRPSHFIEPCIPTRAPKPPAGPDWVHEIKHDGYRLQVRRERAWGSGRRHVAGTREGRGGMIIGRRLRVRPRGSPVPPATAPRWQTIEPGRPRPSFPFPFPRCGRPLFVDRAGRRAVHSNRVAKLIDSYRLATKEPPPAGHILVHNNVKHTPRRPIP